MYPALTKLTAEGMGTVIEQAQEGQPDEKYYPLTETGQRDLSTTPQVEPSLDQVQQDRLLILFFAEHRPPWLTKARINHCREELACIGNLGDYGTKSGTQDSMCYSRTVF